MKKVSGLILLLFACLLVSMPVAAEPFEASNGFALESSFSETKIDLQEEVVVYGDSETLALPAELISPEYSCGSVVLADAGLVVDDYCLQTGLLAGGVPLVGCT